MDNYKPIIDLHRDQVFSIYLQSYTNIDRIISSIFLRVRVWVCEAKRIYFAHPNPHTHTHTQYVHLSLFTISKIVLCYGKIRFVKQMDFIYQVNCFIDLPFY